MLDIFIKNIISRLIAAGIEDPTHEIITCKFKEETLKFRLYSQEQWDKMTSTQNTAVQLYSKEGWSNQPDSVITHKDKVYLVKLFK